MKRDMELIRRILLEVEDDKFVYGARIEFEGHSSQTCAYHVALILDAGLAVGEVLKTPSTPYFAAMIHRLTSSGHDFCDGIRNDTIWNKAKQKVIKPGASYGLSVLIEWVKIEVRQMVFGTVSG
jgi:hypothetical protein